MNYQFNDSVAIYMQLYDIIKIDIISGSLKPNEKLLSVRELSLKYKVNPNTMQKALSELENDKLIYTERTNGKFVTNNSILINENRNLYAKKLASDYISKMKMIGYENKDMINILKEMVK